MGSLGSIPGLGQFPGEGKGYLLQLVNLMGFPSNSDGKASASMQETWFQSLGQKDPLEKEMATHSSVLAWRISWTEEPGGLQSIGSQRATNTYFRY